MIRRRRAGQEYWSFPGGGIKRGETPQRAARREVSEELGLDVRPERLLVVASGHALFLATIDDEPPLRMQGPEVARRSRRHRYQPQWLPLDQLTVLDVRPRTARVALVHLTTATRPARLDHDLPDLPGLRVEEPIEVLLEERATPSTRPSRWALAWRRWRPRAVLARRRGAHPGRGHLDEPADEG
jgi:8-oxo-dGTP pyrophosphatase MutT (NUDIX family)